MQTDAGEEIQRPVLAEQIPASHIDERARRQLEFLRRRAAFHRTVHHAQPPLEPAAVAERCRRRFLDRHQQIALGFIAVTQFRQLRRAAE